MLRLVFNRYIAPLPFFNLFSLVNIVIARPKINEALKTVSIVVPARNEEGNIEEIVKKLPKFKDDELIFIEGNSTDDTWDKIKTVTQKYSSSRK